MNIIHKSPENPFQCGKTLNEHHHVTQDPEPRTTNSFSHAVIRSLLVLLAFMKENTSLGKEKISVAVLRFTIKKMTDWKNQWKRNGFWKSRFYPHTAVSTQP